jgi:hypothetical protein
MDDRFRFLASMAGGVTPFVASAALIVIGLLLIKGIIVATLT